MIPYLLLWTSTPLFAYFAGKQTDRYRKIILMTLTVLTPAIIAGVRGDSVGTDTMVYGVPGLDLSREASFSEYLSEYGNWHPLGYCLITWIVGHTFHSRIIYFAVIQLFAFLPVYYSLNHQFKKEAWIGVLFYCLVIFPISLNAMKQVIAASFGVAAMTELINKRPISALLLIVAAILFHQTAVVLFLLIPLFYLVKSWHKIAPIIKKHKIAAVLSVTALILCCVCALINWKAIVRELTKIRPSFAYVLSHIGEGQIYESAAALLLVCIIVECFYIQVRRCVGLYRSESLNQKEAVGRKALTDASFAVMLIGMTAMQLDILALGLSRISIYGLVFGCLWIASLLHAYGQSQNSTLKYSISVLVLACIVYAVFTYFISGAHEVYPYELCV